MARKKSEQDRTPKRRRRKPWKAVFISTLATTGNVLRACKACKIGRTNVYQERIDDQQFSIDWDRALEDAADLLEMEARRRAFEGLTRKKFTGKGTPVIDPSTKRQYFEREYSDVLLIFLLKGLNPEKFRERVSNEHSGPGGKPITVSDGRRTSRIAELIDIARARGITSLAGSGNGKPAPMEPPARPADDGIQQPS